MDPLVYAKTHTRIRDLREFEADQGDPLGAIVSTDEAKRWRTVFDNEEYENQGLSYGIPLDRVLILSQNRKVPAAYLPSYVAFIGGIVDGGTYIPNSADPRLFLPRPGDPDYGNMNLIYKVKRSGVGEPDIFYRYIYLDPATISDWYEVYHSIPVNMKFINGNGTLVSDIIDPSTGTYSRRIDVNVGAPSAHSSNILALSGGTLVHTLSSSTSQPGSTTAQTPAFGGTFSVPRVTLDTVTPVSTAGHVDSMSDSEMTFPSSTATTGSAGLLTIGTNIRPIGYTSAGTTGSPVAAAADHVHSMAMLEFEHDGFTLLRYNGTTNLDFDFREILKASLPAAAAATPDTYVLVSNGATTNNQYGSTEWKPSDYMFASEFGSAAGTRTALNEQIAQLCTLSGITAGGLYMVNVDVNVQVTAGAGGPVTSVRTLRLIVGGIEKRVTIPSTYSTEWNGTLSWIVEAGPVDQVIIVEGQMLGITPNDVNENSYGVECKMRSTRLR